GHAEPEAFPCRVRAILTAAHKRNKNVLNHEIQEEAARLMGCAGTPRQQVERLMGDYFRHARAVSRSLAWVRQAAPVPVAANLVRSRDGIRFVDASRADASPESWLSLFAAFQALFCRVVRDFYHKYTVDEHTLLTIRNLERLATGVAKERERFGALLADLAHPELLVLSLLFHDVGKWRDDDHAEESVRMARQMFDRLALPPESRAIIEFLIENHLRMSIVAFRRDTEDPEIVKHFADLAGIEERL